MAELSSAPAETGAVGVGVGNDSPNTLSGGQGNDSQGGFPWQGQQSGQNHLPPGTENKNDAGAAPEGQGGQYDALVGEMQKPEVQAALSQMTMDQIESQFGKDVATIAYAAGLHSGLAPQQPQIPPELMAYMAEIDEKTGKANERLERVKAALLGEEQMEMSPEEQLEAYLQEIADAKVDERLAAERELQAVAVLESSYMQAASEFGEEGAQRMLAWAEENGGLENWLGHPDPLAAIGDAMAEAAIVNIVNEAATGNAEAKQVMQELLGIGQQGGQTEINDISVGSSGRSGMGNVVDLEQRKEALFNR